ALAVGLLTLNATVTPPPRPPHGRTGATPSPVTPHRPKPHQNAAHEARRNKVTIVYTPKKPRYIIRENTDPYMAYDDLAEARHHADRLQARNPEEDYDVIDTQGENQ